MKGLTIVQEGGIRFVVSLVSAASSGVPVLCPAPHPDRVGQRCNRVLMHLRRVGDQTIRCLRCGSFVRVAESMSEV